jgi:hypothetical protein
VSAPLLPVFLATLLFLQGCGQEDEMDGLYLLAANALGPEAHQDREMVVNPRLLDPGNPRMAQRALGVLQAAGFGMMGEDGLEDPGKATLYFTSPVALEEDRYRLRIYVSLGARPGRMDRGDSWWEVQVGCREGCQVMEVTSITPPGFGRSDRPR